MLLDFYLAVLNFFSNTFHNVIAHRQMSDFATESLFHLLCKKSGFVLKNGDDDNKISEYAFINVNCICK